MTRREPPWDALRTFGEVMRDRSLSSAARKLSLSQPTVGRHIDALEAALGVALFMRSPRGLEPTQEARDLAPARRDDDRRGGGARARPPRARRAASAAWCA